MVDLKALLAFTHLLDPLDPRLGELTESWRIQYSRYITTSRLKVLQEQLAGGTHLPQASVKQKSTLRASRKSKQLTLRLDNPSMLGLRYLAVFGVSARADILAYLTQHPEQRITASYLAKRIDFTKFNVAQILNELCKSLLCTVEKESNTYHYRLDRIAALRQFIAPYPKRSPPWSDIFAFLLGWHRLAKTATQGLPRAAAIELVKLLDSWTPKLKAAGVEPPSIRSDLSSGSLVAFWDEIQAWLHQRDRSVG